MAHDLRSTLLSSGRPRILLVDDDPGVLSALRRVIGAAEPGWDVWTARSGSEALRLAEGERVSVVISDLHMPEMDGLRLLRRFKQSHPETFRVVHSSRVAALGTQRLRGLVHRVIAKPTPAGEIMALLRSAVRCRGVVRHAEAF